MSPTPTTTLNMSTQTIIDKFNNTLTTITALVNEIKFKHHNGQLMKRRKMLQKRCIINQAKAHHQRKKFQKIESRKAAIREFFNNSSE